MRSLTTSTNTSSISLSNSRIRTLIAILLGLFILNVGSSYISFYYRSTSTSIQKSSATRKPISPSVPFERHQHGNFDPVCIPYPTDKVLTRAAVVFFDISGWGDFTLQMRWWYRSWIEMKKYELPNLRTDLVIAVHELENPFLAELGCTTVERKSPNEPSRCVLAQYTPYKKRIGNESKLTWYLKKYSYFYSDSISVLSDLSGVNLKIYDWLLRTDIDTWFTPAFGNFIPPSNCSIYPSIGFYLFENYTVRKLERVADYLGLHRGGISEPGSAYFASSSAILNIVNMTNFIMLWLVENEWSPKELEDWGRAPNWPYWHAGVLTMYSTELAMNHVAGEMALSMTKKAYQFDCPSSEDRKSPNSCYTIHAFQSASDFAKHKHEKGEYDSINIEELKWNEIAKDYCTYIAVDSKRKNATQLREMNDLLEKQRLTENYKPKSIPTIEIQS